MKKNRQRKSLCSLLLFFSLFSFFAYAENDPNGEIGASLISATATNIVPALTDQKVNAQIKKSIIAGFCNALHPSKATGLSNGSELYLSDQSIFLFFLCNKNELKADYTRKFTQEYLKPVSFSIFKSQRSCQKKYQEDCNMAQLTDELMIQIFSELFTLKQAELFGLTQMTLLDEGVLNKKINTYAMEKFRIERFCDNPHYKYGKTCDIMKRQMRAFTSAFKNFKILNPESLYEKIKDKEPDKELSFCSIGPDYDLVLCGLVGETTNGLKPFINLLYNELAWYTMFATYYERVLGERSDLDFPLQDEITQLKQNQKKFPSLVGETLDDLIMFATTYPIHIGFLAYQEDLLRFRDHSLSKLVTPFYALYHKLRNVQTN